MTHYNAHAKINLGLRILGKREDGYHEIETIFQEISLCDVLTISPHPHDIVLTCNQPGLPTDEGNLVYRAVRLLLQEEEQHRGCIIHLQKKIPIGAGLGGGSSDAAVALKALNNMWNLNLTQQELLKLAGQLGSDVPFFILGGAAVGTGRGEILHSVQIPSSYWGVLIYTDIPISTKWVYEIGNFDLTKTLKSSKFYSLTNHVDSIADWDDHLNNDLQPIVFSQFPYLQSILDRLKKMGAFYARMSGSGSSLFGLFIHKKDAVRARQQIYNEYASFLFHPINSVS